MMSISSHLDALIETSLGEPGVAVPVSELRKLKGANEAWCNYAGNSPSENHGLAIAMSDAADDVTSRLPAPKVDHVAELRALLEAAKTNEENCRDRDISGAEWWKAKIRALEAAIAAMENAAMEKKQ
jgi:hypothetical protein